MSRRPAMSADQSDADVPRWAESARTSLGSALDDLTSQGHSQDGDGRYAETDLRTTAERLRRWSAEHPCPDHHLRDRLDLLVARLGYLSLIAGTCGVADQRADSRVTAVLAELTAYDAVLRERAEGLV